MAKSIMEQEGSRTCYICGAAGYMEEHHVFYGSANRKKSEKWGVKVHLCYRHHRDLMDGVHGNAKLDRWLKQEGQQAFERIYGHEKFMKEFGKNYIEKQDVEQKEPAGQQDVGFWFVEER